MADSGLTDLAELVTLIEGHEQVDIRMALARIADGWQVLNGEVTLGAAMPTGIRTWRYPEEVFVQRSLPGHVIAALVREEPQNLDGLKVTAPPPSRNGTFNRVAGQHEWSHTVTPWPRTVWDVSRSDSTSTRQGGLLVGDGPSFVSLEAAFSAFFYNAAPSNLAPQHPLWRIHRADRRAWLRKITIAPDTVTVAVAGTQLTGVSLELSTPTRQLVRPVGRTRRVRLRVSDGLPYSSLLILRTDDDWLDHRYFITATAGRGRDPSVVWDFPGAELRLLVAGGEGPTVEFKQEIPTTTESKRKVLKTVAAFASGDGGTVLFGVDDDAQVVGINPATIDQQMLAVGSMIRNSIEPEPPYTIRLAELDGKTLLLVEVNAGGRWYALNPAKPEFYLRRGASTVPARLGEIGAGFGYQPPPGRSIHQQW